MAKRLVTVPSGSPLLADPSTEVLHRYPNALVLIRTDGAPPEAGGSDETAVATGVRLKNGTADDLDRSRALLSAVGLNLRELGTTSLGYVEFVGPVDPDWLLQLTGRFVTPLRFQPQNSYLCRGTLGALREVGKLEFVLHVTPLTDSLKPQLTGVQPEDKVDVLVTADATAQDAQSLVAGLGALPGVEVLAGQKVERVDFTVRFRARVSNDPGTGQDALLKQPLVLAVEPFQHPVPEDEVADLILSGRYDAGGVPAGSYLTWLEDHGLNGAGVTIGVVDNGVDVSHPAFQGRIRDLAGGVKQWHATFVAGHAAGAYLTDKDSNGFIYGVGMAPAANLLAQDSSGTPTAVCLQTVTEKGISGVPGSVQNNSWGKGTQDPMDYSSEEATWDALVRNSDPNGVKPRPLLICFSSGNSGAAGLTRPKAAKNVIITGNSQNYRPALGDQSSHIDNAYTGPHPSSWGNCGDGRVRPHVMAPGEWTSSANFDSHQGEPEYINPRLTWGGGSSGASPKTAGACALLIQWWRLHNAGNDPSPAMLRALIVNGAVPMATGGAAPNVQQGWGRVNLDNVVSDAVDRFFIDQTIMLRQIGEQRAWTLRPTDPSRPVKVTLAWTDPPGPIGSGGHPGASPIINKLALRAELGGHTYHGGQEQIRNGWSIPDGPAGAEGNDNLQNIFLPPGTASGTFRISVTALNVTTNCLGGGVIPPQQDFALVVVNGHLEPTSTPSDVYVLVDKATNAPPKPGAPDDHWHDPSGGPATKPGTGTNGSPPNAPAPSPGGDSAALDWDWWDATDPATGARASVGPSGTPTPVASGGVSGSDDGWWDAQGSSFSQPEATRSPDRPAPKADAAFTRDLAAGLDVLTSTGAHRVMLGPGGAADAGGAHVGPQLRRIAPESTRADDHAAVISESLTDLSGSLSNLMANWDHFGASEQGIAEVRRRVAVIVVGTGTRVTLDDVAALRRLSFRGELYLVSADPVVLAFLAQRIHRRIGIHFRVASDAAELPLLLRDTLAEAGGAQLVRIDGSSAVERDALVSTFRLDLIDDDRQLVLRVGSPDAEVTAIELRGPGGKVVPLDPAGPGGVSHVLHRPGSLQIEVDAPSPPRDWAGAWTLRITQGTADPAKAARVTAWSHGGPRLLVSPQDVAPGDAGRSEGETQVRLSGTSGTSFVRAVLPTPRVASIQPQPPPEDPRDLIMAVAPSRLDAGSGPVEEAGRSTTRSATLSHWLSVPPAPTGATVLDVPLDAFGLDAGGNRFARRTRTNLIRLEPRSAWRKRLGGAAGLTFVEAEVGEVEIEEGKVVRLGLRNGDKKRTVRVTSDLLATTLATVDLSNHVGARPLFGVSGDELEGIIWQFGADSPAAGS